MFATCLYRLKPIIVGNNLQLSLRSSVYNKWKSERYEKETTTTNPRVIGATTDVMPIIGWS